MTTEATPGNVPLSDQLGHAYETQPLVERAAFEAWFLARYSYTRAVLTNPIWARYIADAEEAFSAGRAAERERSAAWLRWYDRAETRRSEAISNGDHWAPDLALGPND